MVPEHQEQRRASGMRALSRSKRSSLHAHSNRQIHPQHQFVSRRDVSAEARCARCPSAERVLGKTRCSCHVKRQHAANSRDGFSSGPSSLDRDRDARLGNAKRASELALRRRDGERRLELSPAGDVVARRRRRRGGAPVHRSRRTPFSGPASSGHLAMGAGLVTPAATPASDRSAPPAPPGSPPRRRPPMPEQPRPPPACSHRSPRSRRAERR